MKRFESGPRLPVRLALSLPLCYAPPLLSYFLLRANGPLVALLVYATLVEALFLSLRLFERSLVATVLTALILAAGAAAVLIALNITPVSAFLAWFRLVQSGQGGGTIAFMFATDFAFFSSLFAGIALTADVWIALFGFLFVNALIIGVIFQSTVVTVCALVVLIAFVGYCALRQVGKGRLGLAVPALEVLGAAGLLVLLFAPLKIRNGAVDELFSVDLQGPVSRIFPGFPFLYNVPGYGYSFTRSDLGGRPALTSRPVFEVSAAPGETLYLRTAVYSAYTGDGWALSRGAEEAARAAAKKQAQHDFVAGPAAGTPAGVGATAAAGISTGTGGPAAAGTRALPPIDIKILIDFFASLPNTLDTVTIRPATGSLPPLSYGSPSTGYVLSVPVESGFRIVDSRASPASGESGRYPKLADRSEYLQTGEVSGEVKSLAQSLERSTPAATVASIRSYLANNYRYSLDTKRFRPNTSAVADFLFRTRTGYCVQFASAFTLLARLDGIPARYATGFLVNLPANSAKTLVTGLSAHAWSEVWLAGRGWTTVEATPPMMSSSLDVPGYYREFNPTDSSFTERQLQAIMGARVPPPPMPAVPGARFPFALAGLGAVALALLVLFARGAVLLLLPRPVKVRRIVRKLLRRTFSMQLPLPERLGWHRWAQEVGRSTARLLPLERAASIILELFFGERPAGRREMRFLKGVYRIVRRAGRRAPSRSGG